MHLMILTHKKKVTGRTWPVSLQTEARLFLKNKPSVFWSTETLSSQLKPSSSHYLFMPRNHRINKIYIFSSTAKQTSSWSVMVILVLLFWLELCKLALIQFFLHFNCLLQTKWLMLPWLRLAKTINYAQQHWRRTFIHKSCSEKQTVVFTQTSSVNHNCTGFTETPASFYTWCA